MIRRKFKSKRVGPRVRVQRSHIEQTLRTEIVNGRVPPGGRLPTRTEIESRFGAGPLTVQHALNGLARDGFVRARGSRGTFVADHPPHLSRYALVFRSHSGDPFVWGRYWQALVNEAAAIDRAGDRRMPCFFEIETHPDGEDYQNLMRDMLAHRVAGLIFTSNPSHLLGNPLLEEPGIPRVAIMSPVDIVKVPCVQFGDKWFDQAIGYFVEKGRKRIAALFHTGPWPQRVHEDLMLATLQKYGIEQPAHWRQFPSAMDAKAVCHTVQLLMHSGQSERPDALIVSDDNMLEPATAGLLAAGVRVPADVEIVAHCNFPWPTSSVLPVKRLGYDVRQILEMCTESIDRQRRGEKEPEVVMVPSMFEEEWRSSAVAANRMHGASRQSHLPTPANL